MTGPGQLYKEKGQRCCSTTTGPWPARALMQKPSCKVSLCFSPLLYLPAFLFPLSLPHVSVSPSVSLSLPHVSVSPSVSLSLSHISLSLPRVALSLPQCLHLSIVSLWPSLSISGPGSLFPTFALGPPTPAPFLALSIFTEVKVSGHLICLTPSPSHTFPLTDTTQGFPREGRQGGGPTASVMLRMPPVQSPQLWPQTWPQLDSLL